MECVSPTDREPLEPVASLRRVYNDLDLIHVKERLGQPVHHQDVEKAAASLCDYAKTLKDRSDEEILLFLDIVNVCFLWRTDIGRPGSNSKFALRLLGFLDKSEIEEKRGFKFFPNNSPNGECIITFKYGGIKSTHPRISARLTEDEKIVQIDRMNSGIIERLVEANLCLDL